MIQSLIIKWSHVPSVISQKEWWLQTFFQYINFSIQLKSFIFRKNSNQYWSLYILIKHNLLCKSDKERVENIESQTCNQSRIRFSHTIMKLYNKSLKKTGVSQLWTLGFELVSSNVTSHSKVDQVQVILELRWGNCFQ